MTPCRPITEHRGCALCLRYHPAMPNDPQRRPRTVLIDASVLRRKPGNPCPMYAGRMH